MAEASSSLLKPADLARKVVTSLYIPGSWANADEFLQALVKSGEPFEHKDGSIVNTASGQEFVFDFLKANVTEVEKKFSMRSTNVHPCDAVVETKLLNHQGIVGVACLASLSNIQEVLLLGTAILKCGGIAVRVESSGKGVSPDVWISCTRDPSADHLYDTFVNTVSDPDDNLVTCGLHCLGLRDIVLLDPTVTTRPILPVFAKRIIALDAQLMSATALQLDNLPPMKVARVECGMYPADSAYFNPYGLYVLDSVENERVVEPA